VRQKIFRNR